MSRCFQVLDKNKDALISFPEFCDGKNALPQWFNILRGLWTGALEGTALQHPALDGLNLTKSQATLIVKLFDAHTMGGRTTRLTQDNFAMLFLEAIT